MALDGEATALNVDLKLKSLQVLSLFRAGRWIPECNPPLIPSRVISPDAAHRATVDPCSVYSNSVAVLQITRQSLVQIQNRFQQTKLTTMWISACCMYTAHCIWCSVCGLQSESAVSRLLCICYSVSSAFTTFSNCG